MATFSTIEVRDQYTNEVTGTAILFTDDSGQVWHVPSDPDNADYQQYQLSLANQHG